MTQARPLPLGRALLAAAALALAVPAAMVVALPAHAQVEPPPQLFRAYLIGIQEELDTLGYKPGPADGVMGSRTRAAIMAYQRNAGLAVDGRVSQMVLDHMKFAVPRVYASTGSTAAAPRPAARAPATNDTVLQIQRELAARGWNPGPADGLAGPRTREAARQFQVQAGLATTGTLDAGLLNSLKSADPAIRAR